MNSPESKSLLIATPMALSACMGLLLAAGMTGCTSAPDAEIPAARRYALDSAWSFACAINDMPRSRARHQQRVAEAYIEAGDIQAALDKAAGIEGWRADRVRGSAAIAAARRGKRKQAETLISGLTTNMLGAEVWSSESVELAATEARAWLAKSGEIEEIITQYRQSKQHASRAVAYGALAVLCAGDADRATQLLQDVTEQSTMENLVWQTEGFLLLADAGKMNTAQIERAVSGATNSVTRVGGNRALELLADIAEVSIKHNLPSAVTNLESATTAIIESKFPPHIRGPLVARVTRLWALQGSKDKFNELVAMSEELVLSDMISITERPAMYALLGEAYLAAGDQDKALEAYRKGLAETARQVNPRPRAISAIDICLSMAHRDYDADKVETELTALLGTF